MDFEYYLIDEEVSLTALKYAVENLQEKLGDNYGEISKGAGKNLLNEINSLIWIIEKINNIMLDEHKKTYKALCAEYGEDYL